MNRHRRLLACALLSLALAGCASVKIQGVATGGGEAAYELEGTHLPVLEAEARRLCPGGYDTRRQWQNRQHLNNEQLYPVRLWDRITGDLNTPTNSRAQLAVVCKAPAPAPTSAP